MVFNGTGNYKCIPIAHKNFQSPWASGQPLTVHHDIVLVHSDMFKVIYSSTSVISVVQNNIQPY